MCDNWLRTVLEGRLEGKNTKGRKRIMMLDGIKGGKTYDKLKEKAFDKDLPYVLRSFRSYTYRQLPLLFLFYLDLKWITESLYIQHVSTNFGIVYILLNRTKPSRIL